MIKKTLVVLSVLVSVVGLGFYLFLTLPALDPLRQSLTQLRDRNVYQREITIFGLEALDENALFKLLPLKKSNFFWILNRGLIETSLLKNPFIREAQLKRCTFYSLSCFELSIVERVPKLVAQVGVEKWLVADDGVLLAPTNSEERARFLPRVNGVFGEQVSAEMVRARFDYLKVALEVIEDESALEVEHVDLGQHGELKIRFRGLGLKATFDVPDNDFGKLREEARRLKRLLQEFEGHTAAIENVDLAFNKLAVINLVE